MNFRPPLLVLSAFAFATACLAAEKKADEVPAGEERTRAAFLEDAPDEAVKSMKAVLVDECDRVREEPPRSEAGKDVDFTWLCGGKSLRYLREVLLDGTKVDDGYICDAAGLEKAKFLPLDMIEHQRCVWVSFDYVAGQHDLDLDTQLRAAVE
jgi:hypothetical protein